jgi:FKBP-type peptidyl-prolyl cis-trans isomerase FklB
MFKTELEKVSYSLGLNVANSLKQQGFEEINTGSFAEALADIFTNKDVKINDEEAKNILNDHFNALQQEKFKGNIETGKTFLEENKAKEGVIELPSGLQYIVLNEGEGEKAKATDTVTTHYEGTLIDGKVFDSSVQRGEPATFPVNGVIAGWTEALQLMAVGSKWRLFVPQELAYGANAAGPDITPYSTLIFDVELISIN